MGDGGELLDGGPLVGAVDSMASTDKVLTGP